MTSSGRTAAYTGVKSAPAFMRSPVLQLVGQRLLMLIPVLLGVTLLTSVLLHLLPGDTAAILLGTNATPQSLHKLTIELHLNEPFIVRYWHWLLSALRGDLGNSLSSNVPVSSLLWRHLPVTLELVAYGFVVAVASAIPIAVLAARRPGGVIDRVVGIMAMGGLSVAPFVLALLLVLLLADTWTIFPAIGWVPITADLGSNLWSLTLPAVSLGFPLACFYTRMLRGDIVEQMVGEDYVVAAQGKGLGRLAIIIRHALRNSLLGLITVIGLNIGTLIGGTVVVESIFSLPGIGNQMLTAIDNRDLPLVEGTVLVFAFAVVVSNLVADLLLGVLDPRIRHGRSAA